MEGRRVRFRSFTTLRSPLALAHAQFSAWHDNGLPRDLFYSLSKEMLLFRDPFKLLRQDGARHANPCLAGRNAGGTFLDLPLETGDGLQLCDTAIDRALCKRLMIALLRRGRTYFGEQSHATSETTPTDLRVAAGMLEALPANATYGAQKSALSRLRPATRHRLSQMVECVMGHTDQIRWTLQTVGCDQMIERGLRRLGKLSHVLFVDASKFTLEHVLDLASLENGTAINLMPMVNVGTSQVPFNKNEIEPHNHCAMRFCALQHRLHARMRACAHDHDLGRAKPLM